MKLVEKSALYIFEMWRPKSNFPIFGIAMREVRDAKDREMLNFIHLSYAAKRILDWQQTFSKKLDIDIPIFFKPPSDMCARLFHREDGGFCYRCKKLSPEDRKICENYLSAEKIIAYWMLSGSRKARPTFFGLVFYSDSTVKCISTYKKIWQFVAPFAIVAK